MVSSYELAYRRLHSQGICEPRFETAEEIVGWLGAVQSQDYGAAKWAVALRSQNLTETSLDRALDEGRIVRTHLMRPTWHFVAPADLRWLLKLTAPRVKALTAYYDRKSELDEAIFEKCKAVLTRSLTGGKQLTRLQLATGLQEAGIATDDLRLTQIMMRAELDGVVCSGGRQGKQFTYALLEEWVPACRELEREEALATLAYRYFRSHGPATVADFIWWSGLSAADARTGLELVKSDLVCETVGEGTYWLAPATSPGKDPSPTVYLLPNFDEYTVGYTDRSAIFDTTHSDKLDSRANSLLGYVIVLDGEIKGFWRRTLGKRAVTIETTSFEPLPASHDAALAAAAERYGRFLGLPVKLA